MNEWGIFRPNNERNFYGAIGFSGAPKKEASGFSKRLASCGNSGSLFVLQIQWDLHLWNDDPPVTV